MGRCFHSYSTELPIPVDLNGDSALDLAGISEYTWVAMNSKSGISFSDPIYFSMPALVPEAAIAADLNLDSREELAVLYQGIIDLLAMNANQDGAADLSDAIFTPEFLFLGREEPPCRKSLDADDSGELDVTDPITLLEHLFLGGAPPPPPFSACGPDPTGDPLPCTPYALT